MRTLVVTNYNYAHFLAECLDSVVNQSLGFEKIIFVDDGSTDESISIANRYGDKLKDLKILSKANGGQLSCLNCAVPYIEDDDLVFFLDSDDSYPPDYLESIVGHFDAETDVVFCNAHYYRAGIDEPLRTSKVGVKRARMLPCSSSITRYSWAWIGNPTSTMSMRGRILKMILPYGDERNWKTRADDLLVWGASLVGASKKYVPSVAVSYRVHGGNNFFGKKATRVANRNFNIEVFFSCMIEKNRLSDSVRMKCLLTEIAVADIRMLFVPNVSLAIKSLVPVAYAFAFIKVVKHLVQGLRLK